MYYPASGSSRFTPAHGPASFSGTIVAASAPDFKISNLFNLRKIFGCTPKADTRKMSASDPDYEIPTIALSPPEFDIQNVTGAVDLQSHDELSVIEPMETHDDIPAPSRMVDHDPLGRKQSPTRSPVSPDLDISAMITDVQANMAELIQESKVLIADYDKEQKAKYILRKVM